MTRVLGTGGIGDYDYSTIAGLQVLVSTPIAGSEWVFLVKGTNNLSCYWVDPRAVHCPAERVEGWDWGFEWRTAELGGASTVYGIV